MFAIDDKDNIYCCFYNNPILRKYDSGYNLIYEKKLDKIPEVKKIIKDWKKEIKENPQSSNHYAHKGIVKGICVDEDYLYIMFGSHYPRSVYIFKKDSLQIVRKLVLHVDNRFDEGYLNRLACSDEHLYCLDNLNMTILKYEK